MASIHKRSTASGTTRFDVRYRLPSGQTRTKTFRVRKDANQFAATVEADKARGGLVDPRSGRVTLAAYASGWLAERPNLRPRTVELYEGLLRLHILPALGSVELGRLDSATVRRWNAAMVRKGDPGPVTAAKAYRLLRTVLSTAVEDGLILANPCRVHGAGVERSAERPTVGPAQVWALAGAVPEPRRCLVLLAGFCGLRLGEALALSVRHCNVLHDELMVERQLQEVGPKGRQIFTEPKTEAGRRVVRLPDAVSVELERHLGSRWAGPGIDGLLFRGEKGGPLRRAVFNREYRDARAGLGLDGIRFHDLRHSALTMMAATGATVAELQAHAGHASPQAALRYQHATKDRASDLARLVNSVIAAESEPGQQPALRLPAR